MAAGDHDWTQDVYVRDLTTGTTAVASAQLPGAPVESTRGDSYNASLSGDRRHVAFSSYADDLLPGDLGTLGGVEEVYASATCRPAACAASRWTPPGPPVRRTATRR